MKNKNIVCFSQETFINYLSVFLVELICFSTQRLKHYHDREMIFTIVLIRAISVPSHTKADILSAICYNIYRYSHAINSENFGCPKALLCPKGYQHCPMVEVEAFGKWPCDRKPFFHVN